MFLLREKRSGEPDHFVVSVNPMDESPMKNQIIIGKAGSKELLAQAVAYASTLNASELIMPSGSDSIDMEPCPMSPLLEGDRASFV